MVWFKTILNHCGPGSFWLADAVSLLNRWSGRWKEQLPGQIEALKHPLYSCFSLQSTPTVALQNECLGFSPPLFLTKILPLLKVNWIGKKTQEVIEKALLQAGCN